MKKYIFILGVILLCQNVKAEDSPSEVNHWSCGTNCRATLYSDGLFKVEQEDKTVAKAVMNNYMPTTDENGEYNLNTSPWARSMKDVSRVEVADGVEHIGSYAFYGALNASEVKIANSVTSIGQCGVGGTGFTHVEIPESVTSLGIHAFHSMRNLESFVIAGTITEVTNVYGYGVPYTLINASPNVTRAYCEAGSYTFCLQALGNDGASRILKTYTKDGNFYIFDDKRYKSIKDYENGKEMKRIYTVDEANRVAGEKNRVSIKYR